MEHRVNEEIIHLIIRINDQPLMDHCIFETSDLKNTAVGGWFIFADMRRLQQAASPRRYHTPRT